MIRIPAKAGSQLELRCAPLTARDKFNPLSWPRHQLTPSPGRPGWFEIDIAALGLADGAYEYEFILDGRDQEMVPDPFAEEIAKFGGYRGVFHIVAGRRWRQPFSWEDELPSGARLAQNNELVIYEMPLRWMESAPERIRQVGLGTFEKVAFMRLDLLADLGINAIELLPVQDSPDTLNWGYGTRFFFAPDFDMGAPTDFKWFVKQCHRRGIRVLLDVVMNHDNQCPLRRLDFERYFLRSGADEPGRGDDYGQKLFRYREPDADGTFAAREFHFQWAEFLIRDYHVDGFRIDEFRGIDNWEFVQEFRDRAWRVQQEVFPDRPFLVVAEDSWRRAVVARDDLNNPNGRKVTDAIWNFAFRDEARRLLLDEIRTAWGEPSRRDRVRWCIAGWQAWNDLDHSVQPGFGDIAQAVNYLTSHDVEGEPEKRIMNFLFAPLLRQGGFGSGLSDIRWVADHLAGGQEDGVANDGQRFLHGVALDRLRSAFALLLTAVGIPMILAGDEFGDVHDLDHSNWRLKMSDPIDWERRQASRNNLRLWTDVRSLIALRKGHPALLRNEVDFFWFHPTFDGDGGERVFVYCRTAGKELGRPGQVVVVVNAGTRDYPSFDLPWHWVLSTPREVAPPTHRLELAPRGDGWARLSLAPFQVRVFEF